MSLQVRGVIVRKLVGSLLCSAAVAAFCLPSALQAQAPTPTKVAIINAQKAVADTQEIQKAQKDLEVKYAGRHQPSPNYRAICRISRPS